LFPSRLKEKGERLKTEGQRKKGKKSTEQMSHAETATRIEEKREEPFNPFD